MTNWGEKYKHTVLDSTDYLITIEEHLHGVDIMQYIKPIIGKPKDGVGLYIPNDRLKEVGHKINNILSWIVDNHIK